MAALPDLPEAKRRNLESLWTDVIREYGFTGDHLRWHESPERRRKAAEPAYYVHRSGHYYGAQNEEISYEEAVKLRRKRWAERERDPAVIDCIGVDESTRAAAFGLEAFAEVYFQAWIEKPGGEYYEFCDWLEGIATNIENRLRELWEPRGDWYARVCSAEVKKILAPHIKDWREKALSRLKQRPTREFEEILRRVQESLARPLPPAGALEDRPPRPAETSLADIQRGFVEIQCQILARSSTSNRRAHACGLS